MARGAGGRSSGKSWRRVGSWFLPITGRPASTAYGILEGRVSRLTQPDAAVAPVRTVLAVQAGGRRRWLWRPCTGLCGKGNGHPPRPLFP
jgi:hypothetical protein